MSTQPPELVTLRKGPALLQIAPAIGGSITRFGSITDGAMTDWFRPASAQALAALDPRGMACYPLVPFSNRIRNGAFRFAGRDVQLSHSVAHALHGHGWLAPWRVASRADDRLELVFERPADDWPFAYRAQQAFELFPDTLAITLSVENTGPAPMPLGIGLHPYFVRTRRTTLTARTGLIWETDTEILPTRLVEPGPARDLGRGFVVDSLALDNCYTEWSGSAVIDWPERRKRMTMTATGQLSFFVVYTPAGADFFCAEPVSNATDAFNLAEQGRRDTGICVLAPGQTMQSIITFTARATG